ncbi:MAG: EamA family transporter [Pseudomonadota bacterium]|nr:EamA family transporter [Pseudomonadota bacterium]
MSPIALGLCLIVTCSLIEGFAQVSFKLSRVREAQRVMWTVVGFAAYLTEVCLYTLALRQVDVTVAFAMGSLSFVITAALSHLLLKERITGVRGLGLLLILGGVTLMGAQA